MRNLLLASTLCLTSLAACTGDETLTGYGAADRVWHLRDAGPMTIEFMRDGSVSGHAPCNGFFAKQTAPYPWFALTTITATERSCDQMAAEEKAFANLAKMSLVEVAGDTLILSSDTGEQMVFEARD